MVVLSSSRVELVALVVLVVLLGLRRSYAGPALPHPEAGAGAGERAGAEHTNRSVLEQGTVWGHEDLSPGRLEALPEFDLLQQLQRHAALQSCRDALDSAVRARSVLRLAELRMNYASVRLPEALLSGNIYHLGDYDGCMDLRGASYCLAEVEIRPGRGHEAETHLGDDTSPFQAPHGHNATLWDLFRISGNRLRFRRDLQQWGLCLPSECDAVPGLGADLAAALDPLARSLHLHLRVSVEPGSCVRPSSQTSLVQELHRPAFLAGFLIILSFLVLTGIASTLRVAKNLSFPQDNWMAEPEKQGTLSKLLSCFAVPGNWKHLKRKQKSMIHCVQGIRTLTMVGVVLGHHCFIKFAGPLANPEYVETSFFEVLKMLIVNGNIIVSTFFVISGFLEARLSLKQMEKLNGFSVRLVLTSYIHRYLRLMPALGVMLLLNTQWTPLLGSGPVWPRVVGRGIEDCKASWWTNLLFINNYVHPESLCMYQTWFVAADMQLYVVAVPVLWLVHVLSRRPGLGGLVRALLATLLVASACALYFPTATTGLNPMLQTTPEILRDSHMFTDPTFTKMYVATHGNALPYVIGVIAGVIFFHASKVELRLEQVKRYLLVGTLPAASLLQLLAILTGVIFFLPGFTPSPWLDALYGPARQILFAVSTAWIILICGLGLGGVINWSLCWTPLVAMGRLTYCAFLVHVTVLNAFIGSVRQPVHLSDLTLTKNVAGDFFITYMLALFLHLCVEAPLWNMQKLLINRSMKRIDVKSELSGQTGPAGPAGPASLPAEEQADVGNTLPQVYTSKL